MNIIQQQIDGLTLRLSQLKATEKMFLQASGLETQAAVARQESEKMSSEVDAIKAELTELQSRQSAMTAQAMTGFMSRMDAALPAGMAYIVPGEKSVDIGWVIDGIKRPLQALSGGERVAFDVALAHALGAGILVKEVAELDRDRLKLVMDKMLQVAPQVVLVTCHAPEVVPEGWVVCRTS